MLSLILAATLAAIPNDLVVITGQSNADGSGAVGALSTEAQGDNCRPVGNTYSTFWSASVIHWGCTPLVEADRESPATALANHYRTITGRSLAVMNFARGGYAYSQLKRGTTQWGFFTSMMEMWSAYASQPNRVLGAYIVHGEADENNGVSAATYQASLEEWQSDFQSVARLRSNIGSTATLPVYIQQSCAWTVYNRTTPAVALGQYNAAKANAGRIILVGPHYQYARADTVHIASAGIKAMASQAARAIAHGPTWQPVWPTSVTRTGDVIRAVFNVPSPPLVLDTTTVTNPGNYGFEVAGGGSITSVALSGADSVDITVSGAATHLRYAYTGTSGASSGPTTGPRGNLRDSDDNAVAGPNWAVMFSEAVN